MITKEDLIRLYVESDFKSEQVAEELGYSIPTVLKYLHQYGIKIKGIRHYNVHKGIGYSDEQYQFFDGLIGSDGSLTKQGNKNAKISCAFKYEEFATYIKDKLNLKNVHKKTHFSDRYKAGFCIQYGVMSSNNVLFSKERERWYNNGAKLIPDDFRFSPTSMNIFYLSDGYITKKGKVIYLCTNAFEKTNIEQVLIKNLNYINIDCWVTKMNEICIPRRSVGDFLSYIGPCPVECYKYKWLV